MKNLKLGKNMSQLRANNLKLTDVIKYTIFMNANKPSMRYVRVYVIPNM